jgi:xylitol oxidase
VAVENWAGTVRYTPSEVWMPASIAHAQELVAVTPRVRALGTGHSFTAIADAPRLISLRGLASAKFELDESARTVTVPAASTYGAVAAFLHEHGWALRNLGSLPHITVAGACATGTHGSGDGNPVLADDVRAIELIRADGEIEWVDAASADFAGSVIALGTLGIVTRVRLRIEPTYDITQLVYTDLAWSGALERLDEIMASAYSVSLLGRWGGPELSTLWLKVRGDAAEPPATMFGAQLRVVESTAPDDPHVTPIGSCGPWSTRLAHFRADGVPSVGGDEIQTEYFVARDRARDALAAVRGLAESIDPLLHASELRTVAADELWLSPAYRRDSLAIAFTWKKRAAEIARVLPLIEGVLAPFEPRGHWGKLAGEGFDPTANLPEAVRFAVLRDRIDPTGKFGNAMIDGWFPGPSTVRAV